MTKVKMYIFASKSPVCLSNWENLRDLSNCDKWVLPNIDESLSY